MALWSRKERVVAPPTDARARRTIEAFDAGDAYSPIPSREDIERSAARREIARDEKSIAGVDLCESTQLDVLTALAPFVSELPFDDAPRAGLRYHLANDWFAHADGAVHFAMLRHWRPKRLVEIGAGFSSVLSLDVRDRFLGELRCTFIDPDLSRSRALLFEADRTTASFVEARVQDVPPSTFEALEENDVLFIDSSHVAKIGSDVLHLFFEVLPRLKRGVVVHLHDVFHPFEYPEPWIREGRAWNEAYLLRALLQHDGAFRVLFFNDWMARFHREAFERAVPQAKKGSGGSFWMRRVKG